MADGLVKRLRAMVGAGAAATIKPKQLDEWRRQLVVVDLLAQQIDGLLRQR